MQTFDFSLLSDPAFVVFTAFLACGSLTDMIPCMFIANRAVTDYGIDAVKASFLISIIGGSNTVKWRQWRWSGVGQGGWAPDGFADSIEQVSLKVARSLFFMRARSRVRGPTYPWAWRCDSKKFANY